MEFCFYQMLAGVADSCVRESGEGGGGVVGGE